MRSQSAGHRQCTRTCNASYEHTGLVMHKDLWCVHGHTTTCDASHEQTSRAGTGSPCDCDRVTSEYSTALPHHIVHPHTLHMQCHFYHPIHIAHAVQLLPPHPQCTSSATTTACTLHVRRLTLQTKSRLPGLSLASKPRRSHSSTHSARAHPGCTQIRHQSFCTARCSALPRPHQWRSLCQ